MRYGPQAIAQRDRAGCLEALRLLVIVCVGRVNGDLLQSFHRFDLLAKIGATAASLTWVWTNRFLLCVHL